MKKTILIAAATAALSFGATFTGVITDNMCDKADHKDMHMASDAKCVLECVKGMNGKYVLYDAAAKTSYVLSDQKTPEKFAAQKVTVTGTLDAKTKTIQVQSIAPAK
ncbi:MAG: hypothetical protein KGN36_20170 [Acidobacteriota bacterium]|nr:hypothetical protein [Acidobacteriota bacterium]